MAFAWISSAQFGHGIFLTASPVVADFLVVCDFPDVLLAFPDVLLAFPDVLLAFSVRFEVIYSPS